MDYRRLSLIVAAQVGVFAAGVLAFAAFGHQIYATGGLCLLAAVLLAWSGAAQALVHSPGLQRPAGATYTAELGRRRLQVLLDQTPAPLLLLPADGQVIAVNRAARRLFNVAYALPLALRRRLLGESGDFGGAGGQVTGQIIWQGATYAVERTRIEGRDETSDLVVMTDISAEVRAAEATVLRDLLRVLNHELMNALTPVTSMSRTALDILKEGQAQAPAKAIRALERIVARADGLTRFLDAYRELTRLPPPDMRPVDLAPWLETARDSFEAQWRDQGVTLDIGAPGEVSAMMDADQMWLCVGNLLNNAAQAVLGRDDRRVRLDIGADRGRLAFRVQDSGPGIAPERGAQVFLPFYTTRADGSGVGLSLARQIVQSHGGQLQLIFERTAGDLEGACFVFDIGMAAEDMTS